MGRMFFSISAINLSGKKTFFVYIHVLQVSTVQHVGDKGKANPFSHLNGPSGSHVGTLTEPPPYLSRSWMKVFPLPYPPPKFIH